MTYQQPLSNRTILFVSLLLVVFIIVLGLIVPVWAHNPERPELDKWFDGLRSGKGPCCDQAEGQTVLDADWKTDNGHYVVRIPNRGMMGEPLVWVSVPDEAVIKEPNRDGRTIVWPIWNGPALPFIRCFIPGDMG